MYNLASATFAKRAEKDAKMELPIPIFLNFLFASIICGAIGLWLLARSFVQLSNHRPILALSAFLIGGVLSWWAILYALVLVGIFTPSTYSIYARYGLPVLCLGIYFLARKIGL